MLWSSLEYDRKGNNDNWRVRMFLAKITRQRVWILPSLDTLASVTEACDADRRVCVF